MTMGGKPQLDKAHTHTQASRGGAELDEGRAAGRLYSRRALRLAPHFAVDAQPEGQKLAMHAMGQQRRWQWRPPKRRACPFHAVPMPTPRGVCVCVCVGSAGFVCASAVVVGACVGLGFLDLGLATTRKRRVPGSSLSWKAHDWAAKPPRAEGAWSMWLMYAPPTAEKWATTANACAGANVIERWVGVLGGLGCRRLGPHREQHQRRSGDPKKGSKK